MAFPFESLLVYKKSLSFVEKTDKILSSLKGKASSSLLDQYYRAALSIPLNIAEGYGRWHSKDRLHFLRIAKGSIFEIIPIIQILSKKRMVEEEIYSGIYRDLEELVKMLTNLAKSWDKN
ncbi:MAG: four helix bundle protein [Elusimicrobia bacterium]|nr:four helix bundle protein [Candidatus Obscuribacterium magneticum]